MRLVIQIPCLNEETTLPLVFERMPKTIAGIENIDFLVIDDGCTDRTVEVARSLGVEHFVRHTRTMGLGQSFHDGALKALELGADVLVNTDGDNQYPSESIPELVRPIIEQRADIVIGDRQTDTIEHFSPGKKLLQRAGSKVVNFAARTDVPDAASGFRAYSRESLMRINTVTRFSYCTETIIQAGNKGLAVASTPVVTNPKTRESRLFKRTSSHVRQSAVTIIRAYLMYRPMVIFVTAGLLFLAGAVAAFARYLVLLGESGNGPFHHTQSLVAGSAALMVAFLSFALGVIADLTRINRILVEDSLEQTKRERFKLTNESEPLTSHR